jgi:D-psicose/D-tagatose/L-ribulose 3-epimerase
MAFMKFGIHQFVWNEGRNQAELEQAMEGAAAAGFDLLEFPGLDSKAIDAARLVRRAEALGLKLAASAGLRPELDLTSPDPECVRRGEAFLNEAVAIARDIGSTQLSGPIFSAHQKFATLPTERGWRSSTEVLARVADRAKAAGVALCLELVNRYETNLINTVRQGAAYIRDTGSDNIFLHVDTFHMNIEEADQAEAIRYAGHHVGYFHVGENHRGVLGTGTIDFAPAFDALLDIGYEGYVSVEAFDSSAIGDNLKAICAIWRENWSDSDAFARHARAFLGLQFEQAQKRAAAYA